MLPDADAVVLKRIHGLLNKNIIFYVNLFFNTLHENKFRILCKNIKNSKVSQSTPKILIGLVGVLFLRNGTLYNHSSQVYGLCYGL